MGSRKEPSSSNDSKNEDVEESFLNSRYELSKIFHLRDFVKDREDFWLFTKKYEAVQRKAKSVKKSIDRDKINGVLIENLILSDEEKLFLKNATKQNSFNFKRDTLVTFQTILLSYLDFKQKENTAKVKKIKEMQENLPVFKFKEKIVDAVKNNKITIIAGDTGCGKSTQVPQYLLNAGFEKIACTQPRRLACISLSKRVSYETMNKFGEQVGYQIRFEKNRRKDTKIVFITEGLLLRQVGSDGLLSEYDVILLDEIHERHLQGDFLLGLLKCVLIQRPTLKLVLMSATINIPLFESYFGDEAATIQVPGRLYPISVNYMPTTPAEIKAERLDPGPYIRVMQIIDTKYPSNERGDLLIFVSGTNEINTVIEAAQRYNEKNNKWIILPLHSSLSIAEQDKVFDYAPEGMRKCVVSTNIAETSITLDGVRFVMDSGMVKEMSYDPVLRVQRLKEFWVSKASAEQRKGRAGRTGPGVCYRLYSEADFGAMADYTTPEIQRVPLDSLLLQMLSLGLPDARKFPFLEPPPAENIENTILALKQHGAVSENEKLTPIGSLLSRLPVDIPLGKMLICGSMFHQIEPVLSLAAGMSVQTPIVDKTISREVEVLRDELESDHGDPIGLLKMYGAWLEVKGSSRGSDSRKWCKARKLEEQRFYEMSKIRKQFKTLLQECNLMKESDSGEKSRSERALRTGEMRVLKRMRAEAEEKEMSRKRKILRPWGGSEEDYGSDKRDIDFRIMNNQSQLNELIERSKVVSYKDLTLLKVILCSGLYPQVAIPDIFNQAKGVSEQLFHTKEKGYVFLHPLSYFGRHSEVLQISEADLAGGSMKQALTSKHQVLFYMSLLETNRPYLVNSVRMPAAQTLLLFSHKLHTNADFSRIICDSWIELSFPEGMIAEKLLLKVIKLRSQWEELLQIRLQELDGQKLERELSDGLLSLMRSEVAYRMKRLLPADTNMLYLGPGGSITSGSNPFSPDPLKPDPEVGGVYLNSYLTYDCLIDDVAYKMWSCPHCDLSAPISPLQRQRHLSELHSEKAPDEEEQIDVSPKKSNSIKYDCPECKKPLFLTPTEILKHKKSHLST